jgi:RHS repeat-associated protein
MQADGNLVLYDRSISSDPVPSAALWATGTATSPLDPGIALKTLYTYDIPGNLTCVEQHGTSTSGTGCSAPPSSDATSPWRVRRFTYDSLGRLLTSKNPESGMISYAYDIDGNILSKTSPAVNQPSGSTATTTASFSYDPLHRVTAKSYTGNGYSETTPPVTYGYDAPCCGVPQSNDIGRLAWATTGSTELVFQYDVMGRPRAIADCPPSGIARGYCYSITAKYDLAGDVISLTYPDSATTITYSQDSIGRITGAGDPARALTYAGGTTFSPAGQVTGFQSGSISNLFTYNSRLQPVNMSASAPGQTIFSVGYDFHLGNGTIGADNGNVWSIYNYRDRTRDQSFTYDALNRLASAQNAGTDCTKKTLKPNQTEYWGNSYGYDAWGNLASKNITKCSAENLSISIGVNNQVMTSGYGYDAAGNMLSDATEGHSLGYDAESRIKTVDGTGASFTYNPLGNRVRKDVAGGPSTEYFYFNGQVIAELNPATGVFANYIYFDGNRVARSDGTTGPISYYFSDRLKTASVITDSSGNIKVETDYYPWGGEVQFVNNDSNHYKFTGKERDSESGLDYFGARYYSNGLGRFITPDWAAKATAVPYAEFADPQSLNLYSYVRNVPTTRYDPAGHCDWCQKLKNAISGNGFNTNAQVDQNQQVPEPAAPKPFIPPAPYSKPNPVYKTATQAGAAAARADQAAQKQNGAENASSVYKIGNGYTYTDPVNQGQKTTVDPNNTTGVPQGKTVDLAESPIPLGTQQTGEAHSHPDNVGFSGEDVQRGHDMTIPASGHPQFQGEYVGLPNGQVQKYDPATGHITTYQPGEPK